MNRSIVEIMLTEQVISTYEPRTAEEMHCSHSTDRVEEVNNPKVHI